MVAQNFIHENDKGLPYVLIDDIPFRIVEGSFVQVSPLAPFSSSLQAGASSRISDSRLSVEVWDNFTGGLGLRDETDQQVTSYAEGNLDTRVAGYNLPPPYPVAQLATTGYTASFVNVEHLDSSPPGGTDAVLLWATGSTVIKVLRSGSYTTRTAEQFWGFTRFNGRYWYIGWDTTNVHLYNTNDTGNTWTTTLTTASAAPYKWLTTLDNRLVTYDSQTKLVKWSLDGVTFTTHSTMPNNYAAETITALFTWFNPQRSRDTLWAITPMRILWFEEESGEWHTFYPYNGVGYADSPAVAVWRRDDNLYVAPTQATASDNYGFIQMFTGQVADDVSPNERLGLPAGAVNTVWRLQGGVHWLYAFVTGTNGGVYALNEFQGWTMLFDPRQLGTGYLTGTGVVAGGGYDNGSLYVFVNVAGTYTIYKLAVPDRREAVPVASPGYLDRTAYLRSAWTSHNQLARWKQAAYFEVDFRKKDGLAGYTQTALTIEMFYRTDRLATWTSLGTQTVNGTVATNFPLKFAVSSSLCNYRQLQWEVRITDTDTGVASAGYALASVALYYSYWQGNYYAYQFNIDLTPDGWYMEWPDMQFQQYDRDELIAALLGFNQNKTFHTFEYKVGAQNMSISRVDMLVAGREDSEVGGGIYSVTVRDLS